MIKTVDVNKISIHTVISSAKNGDEIVIEENGKPIARVTPIDVPSGFTKRTPGLGKGYWMSDDFDAELTDEFWDNND